MYIFTRRGGREKSAFTLIEMLVVIAIIALLAMILIPVIMRARERANQAYCMNNLREFGMQLMEYRNDHDGKMPPWLSNLYPNYMSAKEMYFCKSDEYGGTEGGKPPDMSDQFPETDDTASNGNTAGRNEDIERCSYFYEFTGVPCSWDFESYLGVSRDDLDHDGDGIVTWGDVKARQLSQGDKYSNGPYNGSMFPVVRCFHHFSYRSFKVPDGAGGMKEEGLTLNAAYSGGVFRGPEQWELGAR